MSLTLLPPKGAEQQFTLLGERFLKQGRVSEAKNARLPKELVELIDFVIDAWKHGQGVTVTAQSKFVTTQEAANLIGCSRQHVVSLMEMGKIPGRKIGTHRRIKLEHVLHFISEEDTERNLAMRELIAVSEEIGGYRAAKRKKTHARK